MVRYLQRNEKIKIQGFTFYWVEHIYKTYIIKKGYKTYYKYDDYKVELRKIKRGAWIPIIKNFKEEVARVKYTKQKIKSKD